MSNGPNGSLQPALIPESPPLAPRSIGAEPSATSLGPRLDRSKYASPAPPATSSITPPPSSQVPQLAKHVLRTPSPPTSQLTSPPPTNRPFSYSQGFTPVNDLPSADEVRNASVEDLRNMVESLSIALREARASAAHFKLQHNMLLIDSTEATKRMEVELQLTQREVEVLQEAEERRRQDYISPAQQAGTAALIEDLNRQCLLLHSENEQLRTSLARTVQSLEDTENVLASLREENSRLRHRIRTNREHMNGILDSVSDGSPRSLFGTPHRPSYHTTPRHPPPSRPAMSQPREPGAFEALLLADKVLNSQETVTAPSTPKSTPLKHRLGHTRNTHSLSSLPSTPSRRPVPHQSALRTPPHLTTIQEPPSVGQPHTPHYSHANPTASANRRRASSDSTITASSVDENTKEHYGRSDDEDIPPSQASQIAASMLRKTPKSSGMQGKLTQTRIIGRVTKPNISESEKRRLTSFGGDMGSPSKKGRVGAGVAVGLGIGLPGERRD
ncbi:uncharacterized protein PV09_01280 [Verruconis gallopava]|uniref:Uncharacterized protein n=1 Tax=Verruconis gallopava TaxID=253628 RepID=A0A0D2BAL2_9PEZI|nr:uncharacterized protein PV09_01280 [Verruconis gallopava]KIW08364.1 hypothetical protein PV09_01280 [Verruconis gallopava]